MRTTRWFVYTVLFAIVPMAARVLVCLVSNNGSLAIAINEGDIISFGLVLAVANINELEHERKIDPSWKTKAFGISVFCIFLFACLFAASAFHSLHPKTVSINRVKTAAAALSFGMTLFSYVVFTSLPVTGAGRR